MKDRIEELEFGMVRSGRDAFSRLALPELIERLPKEYAEIAACLTEPADQRSALRWILRSRTIEDAIGIVLAKKETGERIRERRHQEKADREIVLAGLTPEEIEECRREYDRLSHDDDCEGKHGHKCECGCGQVIVCPGGDLCRMRIMHLTGLAETKAVRAWMRLGLCVCGFVVKNRCRHRVGRIDLHEIGYFDVAGVVSDRIYAKAAGNWSARRRRKLVQCPCGAYYDNDTVRALGLLSESEWARKGYRRFNGGERHYIANPKKFAPYSHLPHVRVAPAPIARIWRPFYEPSVRRFEKGLASVDLFSSDQIDQSHFLLSPQQAAALVNGDAGVAALIREHHLKYPKTKKARG